MSIEREAFYSMLGIARRAGVLTLGTDAVLGAIAGAQAGLVLLDESASDNTKKKLMDSCAYYGAQLVMTQPDRLGFAIGKPGRMCAAVKRGTLCDKLRALVKSETAQD